MGFRCYKSIDLEFNNRINIFYGDNGSGKTSVLEAIYFLSTGKSFRSKKNKNLVNQAEDELVVFAQYDNHQGLQGHIGLSLTKALKKSIKLNQKKIANQSQIAHLLPVVSIDPDSYLFLDKPPQYRRSFLDWLVFHVKHNYLPIWSRVARCQKQLNNIYKNKTVNQITEWEQQYELYSTQLNTLRFDVFKELKKLVEEKINRFIPEISGYQLGYFQGWSQEFSLKEQLDKDRDKNLLYGNLNAGIHKMDIKNMVDNSPAHERLSRGQKKLISIIFYLSFIELLSSELKVDPILCLDDVDAELDVGKTKILSDFIQHSTHQVFISTVDKNKLLSNLDEVGLFHVKHNKVTMKKEP